VNPIPGHRERKIRTREAAVPRLAGYPIGGEETPLDQSVRQPQVLEITSPPGLRVADDLAEGPRRKRRGTCKTLWAVWDVIRDASKK